MACITSLDHLSKSEHVEARHRRVGSSVLAQWAYDLLEALLSRLPVDDVPNGLEVFGLAVLVVEVVGTSRVLACVLATLMSILTAPTHQHPGLGGIGLQRGPGWRMS